MAGDTALLKATSAGVGTDGATFVVLRWEAVDGMIGYLLYRRRNGGALTGPIGGVNPIRMPSSANELRAVVTDGSPEWEALSQTLTAATPGAQRDGTVTPTDPAEAFDRGLTDDEIRLIRAGAQATLTMGRVAGLAYVDNDVLAGDEYSYELRGIRADGTEVVLAQDVTVQAGAFTLPAPPPGVTCQAGDRRVLVLWNRTPDAATYDVQRAIGPGGPFVRINPLPIAYNLTSSLDGSPLPLPQPGLLDTGAWDDKGLPADRTVDANVIDGPDTGVTYYYRVASRDTLDRVGPWSDSVAATPVRQIAPMAADELQVTATSAADGLVVRWRTVTRNVENHAFVHQGDPDLSQTNYIYRSESRSELEDLTNLDALLVATVPSNPGDATTPVLSWTDNDPALVPPYGTKPFFYRVRVTDKFGITGAPSAVIGAAVPDTTSPGPTDIVKAEGTATYIHVEWAPNIESDVAGYQIYRGVCDHGYVFVPGVTRTVDRREIVFESRFHCDMTLIGDVSVGEAKSMIALDGVISFDDYSVPSNSPLCYAYWIRAYDHAGNLYPGDRHGCPAANEYRCAALREETAPQVPVITAMLARNNGVQLEWIGSPEQDLRAFHIYRSEAEADEPLFLAAVLTDGTVSKDPWTGLPPSCAAIPAVADPLAAHGTYFDDTAEPHHVYWYRVSALDWIGNESEGDSLVDIPASSTFTFTSDLPEKPTLLAPLLPETDQCGLDVAWDPPYDSALIRGFLVFRSSAGQPYRQVSDILDANGFSDATARRGIDYRYRVQAMDHNGTLSAPSDPVLHRY
jgi:fibronectin type 3 domain-containing protein